MNDRPARQVNAGTNIGIRVTADLKEALQSAAAAQNVTLSFYCSQILSEAVAPAGAA
ncbi:MAG: hypothetical protein ACPHCN_12095 [Mycobacterium sp.]